MLALLRYGRLVFFVFSNGLLAKDVEADFGNKSSYAGQVRRLNERIQKNPKDLEALSLRAKWHAINYAFEDAIKDDTEAIKLSPNNSGLYFHRGEQYGQINEFEKGIRDKAGQKSEADVLRDRAKQLEAELF